MFEYSHFFQKGSNFTKKLKRSCTLEYQSTGTVSTIVLPNFETFGSKVLIDLATKCFKIGQNYSAYCSSTLIFQVQERFSSLVKFEPFLKKCEYSNIFQFIISHLFPKIALVVIVDL